MGVWGNKENTDEQAAPVAAAAVRTNVSPEEFAALRADVDRVLAVLDAPVEEGAEDMTQEAIATAAEVDTLRQTVEALAADVAAIEKRLSPVESAAGAPAEKKAKA